MNETGRRVAGLLRIGAHRLTGALGSIYRPLTPGQRWTSALALLLAGSMLLFGVPVTVNVRSRPAPPAPATPAQRESPAPPVTALPPLAPPLFHPPDPTPPVHLGPSPPTLAPDQIPSLVALVRTDDSPVPGHDEGSIAKVFIGQTGVATTTTIALDPAATDLCARVLAAGKLVLAGEALPVTLRSCLVRGGATVVAFDADGDSPPVDEKSGQVLSTRRGLEDSLVDLAHWGKESGALDGTVGIVGARSTAFATDAAANEMKSLGINVSTILYLDGSSPTEVPDGVRAFASEGIDVVIFAVPMEVQRRWVAQSAVLGRPFRYVVSDAHDAIVSEAYPAVFDGMLAHTSMRVGWFARTHGETGVQAACRTVWESVAVPPRTLNTEELVRVFIWCQHATIVLGAIRAAETGSPFLTALRTRIVSSPLTSDLGPSAARGYGPTKDAVLVWRAACSCWTESRAFAGRLDGDARIA